MYISSDNNHLPRPSNLQSWSHSCLFRIPAAQNTGHHRHSRPRLYHHHQHHHQHLSNHHHLQHRFCCSPYHSSYHHPCSTSWDCPPPGRISSLSRQSPQPLGPPGRSAEITVSISIKISEGTNKPWKGRSFCYCCTWRHCKGSLSLLSSDILRHNPRGIHSS